MDTLSAGAADAAGAAAVAEVAESALLDVGAAEELVGLAPVPNCPAMKTCAALASFDLISCLVCAVVPVAGAEAGADVEVDADVPVAVNAWPVAAAPAGALPALLT